MPILLERLERLYENSAPEARAFLKNYRVALYDPWVIEELEKMPKPLSRDDVLSVIIEALRR
jgi:hypothetical protein